MIFTHQKTTNAILVKLDEIAEFAKSDKVDEGQQKEVQKCIFEIINILAKEMNLGGQIDVSEGGMLNKLEDKIIPYLNMKEYKDRFINDFNRVIKGDERFSKPAYYHEHWGHEYISIEIGKSPVRLMVGPISKGSSQCKVLVGFFVEFWHNRNYQDYRDAYRNFRKDFLKEMKWDPFEMVDFNNIDSVKELIKAYSEADAQSSTGDGKNHENTENEKNPGIVFANKVLKFYKDWNLNGKNIKEIIEECEKKQSPQT